MASGAPLALAVLAASLLLAPRATANTGSIGDVRPLGDGMFSGTFTASVHTCSDACRWSVRVTITGDGDNCAARTDAAVVYASAEQIGPGTHGPVEHAYYSDTEGAFKLCLLIDHGNGDEVVAELVYFPATPEPASCRPGPDDPACGGLPPPAKGIDEPSRLTRRAARHAAARYLHRRGPGGYADDPKRKLTCRRIDATAFRCTASWRSRGVARQSRLRVRVVSGRVRVERQAA